MNQNKIAAAALLASLIGTTLTANAATVNKTVTVKWNTQAVATLTLNTNYDATGAQQLTAPTITQQLNGGAGACTAAGAGSEAAATVNFGNVTPDAANVTDCQYTNAVNAQVVTNSTNWSLTEAMAAAMPAGTTLCAYANDTAGTANSGTAKTFPFKASAAALAALQTQYAGAAVTNAALGACATNGAQLTVANTTIITGATNAFTAGSPANLGEDLELNFSAAAATGAQTATVNFQLIAN